MRNKTNDDNHFTENDWKLFRKKIIIWQENYMGRLNGEYIHILTQNKNPSENFWQLQKRLTKDKSKPGVMIEMKRSAMIDNICHLLNDDVIKISDLSDFSDTLKETIRLLMNLNTGLNHSNHS